MSKNETENNYPPGRTAWGMVILLMIAYVFSYTDRMVLSILVEPIKADLQLTDVQIGMLLGPAFAIFYATMGLPFGWLADRFRRGFCSPSAIRPVIRWVPTIF